MLELQWSQNQKHKKILHPLWLGTVFLRISGRENSIVGVRALGTHFASELGIGRYMVEQEIETPKDNMKRLAQYTMRLLSQLVSVHTEKLSTRTHTHISDLSIPQRSPEQTYTTIANLTPP